MATDVVTVPASMTVRDLMSSYFLGGGDNAPGTRSSTRRARSWASSPGRTSWTNGPTPCSAADRADRAGPIIAFDLIDRAVVTASPQESCRVAAERMARSAGQAPAVVSPDDPDHLLGIVSLGDLLQARHRLLEEEARRERFYGPNRTPSRPQPG